jgi:hypothetical protein
MHASTASLAIRPYAAGDERAILAAFGRAFADEAGATPRTLDEWRWRFAQNPSGARVMLAVDADGAVRAQFAGLGARLLVEGEERRASHVVDTFCDAAVRGGLARRGLFARTRDAYVEAFGGLGAGRDRLMLGLPAPGAWRVGRAQLGYELLMPVWRLEASADEVPAAPGGVRVEDAERVPAGVDALFRQVAATRPVLMRRDRVQLAWRYDAAPGRRYGLGAAWRGDVLVGLVVLRTQTFDGVHRAVLCDWLVADGDEDTARALRAWCAERARSASAHTLLAVFSEHAPEFLAFQAAGWRVARSRYMLVGKSFERRRDLGWYARRLWWTLGDTDLV